MAANDHSGEVHISWKSLFINKMNSIINIGKNMKSISEITTSFDAVSFFI
jgi:hypothetical protein